MAAGVLVYLQAAGAGRDLLFERQVDRAVALAQQTYVDRKSVEGLQYPGEIPASRRNGRAVRSVGRTHAAAEYGRYAVAQTSVCLLRGYHVDMTVDAAGRKYQMFARYGVGRGAGYQIGVYAVHDVGVAGLAYAGYLAVFDTYIGLDHAQNRIDYRNVGNYQIERTLLRSHRVRQTHAVAYGLAAAVYDLVAVFAQVLFDLNIEIGIAQTYLVAHGRAEKIVVLLT